MHLKMKGEAHCQRNDAVVGHGITAADAQRVQVRPLGEGCKGDISDARAAYVQGLQRGRRPDLHGCHGDTRATVREAGNNENCTHCQRPQLGPQARTHS